MQLKELKVLYKEACEALRQEPEPAEFKMWKYVLGSYDERDVRGALTAWWASERGMFLPKPAQLQPEATRLARIRRYAETPDYCGKCACGWLSKLVDGKITRVPCQCRARVLAARARTQCGQGG
jgi:hypothetical protein